MEAVTSPSNFTLQSSMVSVQLGALAVVVGALGASQASATHYPPGKRGQQRTTLTAASDSWFNITWAVNGTGAPGIYSSSITPDKSYGQYNCE